jgi:hypothetical protein
LQTLNTTELPMLAASLLRRQVAVSDQRYPGGPRGQSRDRGDSDCLREWVPPSSAFSLVHTLQSNWAI